MNDDEGGGNMARKQEMKKCTKTGKVFPATAEFFYRDKSQKDGLAPWSKDAERSYNRAYYAGLKKAKATRKRDIDNTRNLNVFNKTMLPERVTRKSASKVEKVAKVVKRTRRATKVSA
jgi:hypothetical protein